MTIYLGFNPTERRLSRRLLPVVAALMVCPTWAHAQGKSELDALDLKAEPAQEEKAQAKAAQLLVELAAGHSTQRYNLGGQGTYRLSLDGRMTIKPAKGWRMTLSDRLDYIKIGQDEYTINTVREAYVGWQDDSGANAVDVGRVNVRTGPAYGYNPSDFFRDGALRSTTTLDPLALRDNRMGTVVMRAQRLWTGGGLSVIFAPKLNDKPSTSGWGLDLGSTNYAHRLQLGWSQDIAKGLSMQLLGYKASNANAAVGGNLTALVSEYVVAHFEMSHNREASLLDRALGVPGAPQRRASKAVAGVSVVLPGSVSVTAEVQHNGFAMSKSQWSQLAGSGNAFALGAYRFAADRLQELGSRRAVLVYASKKDLGVKGLNLTGFVSFEGDYNTRLSWLDLRKEVAGVELAVQWQQLHSKIAPVPGIISPLKQNIQFILDARL